MRQESLFSFIIKNMIKFRNLKAEEVDVRPAEVRDGKATLLLYQDGRCAMNILDETIGPENWQREYSEAKGLLFCRVGIRDDNGNWVWKADTGSESNIEAGKGLTTDAFKRAAVTWGIGRELYSAPRITVTLEESDLYNEKLAQTFKVSEMEVSNGNISKLVIVDKFENERYRYDRTLVNKPQSAPASKPESSSPATRNQPASFQKPENPTPNENILWTFCTSKEKEPETDFDKLKKFYDFYIGPDMKNTSLSKAAKWTGKLKPEILWNNWH